MIATDVSPDGKEGISSFLEKRMPNFSVHASTYIPALVPWWEEPEFQ